MSKTITFIALIIVCGFATIGVLYVVNSDTENDPFGFSTLTDTLSLQTTAPKRDLPEGSQEYVQEDLQVSFFYPEYYSVQELPQANDSITITFEYLDDVHASGFQLFITPFVEEQITEERFRMDVPSGVRQNLQDITVDGAVGASFLSLDDILGDTYEIWFIKDGYLYELTTLRELYLMLDEVANSWLFY